MRSLILPVLIAALFSLCAARGQDPAKFGGARPVPDQKQPVKADPELEGWVVSLAKRIAHANPLVRKSAQAALIAVGKPALPHLKKLVAKGDTTLAPEARKVISRIKHGRSSRGGRRSRPRRRGSFSEMQAQRIIKTIEKLALEPAITAKLQEFLKSYTTSTKEIGQQLMTGELDRSEAWVAQQKARKAFREALKGVLSKEQYALFEKQMQRKRRRGHERNRGGSV
jgi:hypothetical protein